MKTSRRLFLSGAGAIAATTMMSGAAGAQDVIADILRSSRRGNWNDQFDARASRGDKVASNLPIFSPMTVVYVEHAISNIPTSSRRAAGRWCRPSRSSRSASRPGGRGAPPAADHLGRSRPSDRRFGSLRHLRRGGGEALPGAPRHPGRRRDRQLHLRRPQRRRRGPAQPALDQPHAAQDACPEAARSLRHGEHPGGAGRGGGERRVSLRHTAIVGKVDRPSPIVNSKVTEINFNPFWTVPASIIKKDLIPKMQKDPQLHRRLPDPHLRPAGQRAPASQINWNSDEATKYMFRQDPGDFNSMGNVKINFPSPEGVYMHDTPQSCSSPTIRFEFLGLRPHPGHPRADHLDPPRYAGLGPQRSTRRQTASASTPRSQSRCRSTGSM